MHQRLLHVGVAACAIATLTALGIDSTTSATAPTAGSRVPPGGGSTAPAEPTGPIVLDIGTPPSTELAPEDFHAFGTLDGAQILPQLGIDGFPTFTNGRLVGLTVSIRLPSGGEPNEYYERVQAIYVIGGDDMAGYMAAIRPAILPNESSYDISDSTSTQTVDGAEFEALGLEAINMDYLTDLPDWDVEVAHGVGNDWTGILISRTRYIVRDALPIPDLITTEAGAGLAAGQTAGGTVTGWQGNYGAGVFSIGLGARLHSSGVEFSFPTPAPEAGASVCSGMTPGTVNTDEFFACANADSTQTWSLTFNPTNNSTSGIFTASTR